MAAELNPAHDLMILHGGLLAAELFPVTVRDRSLLMTLNGGSLAAELNTAYDLTTLKERSIGSGAKYSL